MKNSLKTLLTVIIVMAAFLLLSNLFGGLSIGINFGDDAFRVSASKDYSVSVNYDEIKSVELVTIAENHGEILSGGENRRFAWGQRKNENLGTYSLYISKKFDSAVKITTLDNTVIIFNYENEDTTTSIVPMFQELLANRGQSK